VEHWNGGVSSPPKLGLFGTFDSTELALFRTPSPRFVATPQGVFRRPSRELGLFVQLAPGPAARERRPAAGLSSSRNVVTPDFDPGPQSAIKELALFVQPNPALTGSRELGLFRTFRRPKSRPTGPIGFVSHFKLHTSNFKLLVSWLCFAKARAVCNSP